MNKLNRLLTHSLYRHGLAFGLIWGSACGIAAAQDRIDAEYSVRVAPNLESLDVSACYADGIPADLVATDVLQRQLRGRFYVDGAVARPRFSNESLVVDDSAHCFRYRVDLNLGTARRGWGGSYRVGRDVVTKPQHWLMQPRYARPYEQIELRFELPPGISVSAPWPQHDEVIASDRDGNAMTLPVFQVARTGANWDAQIAFGAFTVQRLPIDNTDLRLAVLDSNPPVNPEHARLWVMQAAMATLNVHGHFPQNSPQVLLVPVGRREEAVPFARVLRGGGIGLQFFIDPTRPLEEFTSDWTATHEFSHLLLPYVNRREAWISEGLASYMQNILRVRDGRISEETAWNKLYAGFQRGRSATLTARASTGESRASGSGWGTMRVYWGGAAIWLMADAELRRRSGGEQTVDRALAGLIHCCMALDRSWRGRDLMRELDRITGDTVFTELYQNYADSPDFPPVERELRALGVDIRNGRTILRSQATDTAIRRQIMNKHDTSATPRP